MPLDSEFCTFTFSQADSDARQVFISQLGVRDPIYRTTRHHPQSSYFVSLDDPFCRAKVFGELQASSTDPRRVESMNIVLHDPHEIIPFSSTTHNMRFSWIFTYAGHQFRIRKQSMVLHGPGNVLVEYLVPKQFKDDSPITIAQVLVKKGRTELTMLDHNIARLQIEDVKGLEICIILAFTFFLDYWRETGMAHTLQAESCRMEAFRRPNLDSAHESRKNKSEARIFARLFKRPAKMTQMSTRAIKC
jgi:hypothetical protein